MKNVKRSSEIIGKTWKTSFRKNEKDPFDRRKTERKREAGRNQCAAPTVFRFIMSRLPPGIDFVYSVTSFRFYAKESKSGKLPKKKNSAKSCKRQRNKEETPTTIF